MEYTSGSVQDYYALMKPRVMSLVIFTSLVGLILSPSNIHPFLAVISICCIAIGAGASTSTPSSCTSNEAILNPSTAGNDIRSVASVILVTFIAMVNG